MRGIDEIVAEIKAIVENREDKDLTALIEELEIAIEEETKNE